MIGAAAILFLSIFSISAPGASPSPHPNKTKKDKAGHEVISLDKKFKGKLPITELTEDDAILHALNRLAYGPRPGDVERVRQMGLEKWVDQQLDPEAIDDSTFEARLAKYPTLKMPTRDLFEEFPEPGMAAKQQGLSKEDLQDEMKEKRREAVAKVPVTGNENIDKAQQQLAALVGPNRPVVELQMAKLDRAMYSQRQLEAVMEDFWFNHFNVFANKGLDRYFLTVVCARHDPSADDGQVFGFTGGDGEESGDAVFFGQLAECRSGCVQEMAGADGSAAKVPRNV